MEGGAFNRMTTPSPVNGVGGHTKQAAHTWTQEEDQILLNEVMTNGPRNWHKIAEKLPGRVGRQCRERWYNNVDPEIRKAPWTEEEDRVIMEYVSLHGHCWSTISKKLKGRPSNSVKNRWNSALKHGLPFGFNKSQRLKGRSRTPSPVTIEEPSLALFPQAFQPQAFQTQPFNFQSINEPQFPAHSFQPIDFGEEADGDSRSSSPLDELDMPFSFSLDERGTPDVDALLHSIDEQLRLKNIPSLVELFTDPQGELELEYLSRDLSI